MRRTRTWANSVLILLLTWAISASSSAPASAGFVRAAGKWTQITKGHNASRSNLGLARGSDGMLHVLWAGPGRAPYTAILDTTISPTGAIGRAQTVVSGWQTVHPPAAATAPDGSIHAVVSGQKLNSNVDPNSGLNEIVGPGSWRLPDHAFGSASITEASNADVRSAYLKNGQLLSVWTTAAAMLDQVGSDPGTPPQLITPPGLGNNVEVAVDQATGDAVIAYKGVNSTSSYFRRILPTLDTPQAMPQSRHEEQSVAAPAGGGVYAAYTPDGSKVWLLKFGGRPKSIPVPRGTQVLTAGVATGPAGRLWVFYGNQQNTFVTRTSKGVSCFEPVHRIASPPHAIQYFRLEGEGSAGPLDLFADVTVDASTHDGSYHQQIRPQLSLLVGKQVLKNKRGKVTGVRVTVRVLDACDGVSEATVTGLPGGARVSGNDGSIVFTVPPGKRGRFTLTGKKGGYLDAKGRLSL